MTYYNAINWNAIEDVVDKATWEKLTEQFWLDTRIPLSNDLDDWRSLSDAEKTLVGRVFGGLTLLDTLQSERGMAQIKKDARTPHEEAVLNNIEFMECYTSDHELLTNNGWKHINEIAVGDSVLAYNKDTNNTQFEIVTQVSNHMPEYTLTIGSSRDNIRVSPGHRMLYEESESKVNNEAWEKFSSHTIRADEFDKLPKTYFRRIPLIREYVTKNKNIEPLNVVDRLLIAYQADGSITEREISRIQKYQNSDNLLKTNTFTMRFTFTKTHKIDRLQTICKQLSAFGVTINEIAPSEPNKRNFEVRIPFDLIPNPETLKDKLLENWFDLTDFDSQKAKDFIDEISKWDSHIHTSKDSGDPTYATYYSTKEQNVDFVCAVATLSGYISRKGKNVDDRKDSYLDTHHARVLFESADLTLQSVKVTKEDPDTVYGVEVPSSYLVVRRNKSIMISGNCVHAKSYSSIFSTLNTKSEIEEIFEWTNTNEYLQKKAEIINEIYKNGSALQKKIASVFLETFLFYSGFFTPLYYLGNNKLPNVAEMIKLILRDESVHGTYIGYKFQLGFNELSDEEQAELKDWMYELLYKLYENEEAYTNELYGEVGWVDEVLTFIRYNANKALMNLGQDPLFPDTENDVNPIVMNGISTGTSNHDFFSQVGNGYLLGKVEAMHDSDYDYGLTN